MADEPDQPEPADRRPPDMAAPAKKAPAKKAAKKAAAKQAPEKKAPEKKAPEKKAPAKGADQAAAKKVPPKAAPPPKPPEPAAGQEPPSVDGNSRPTGASESAAQAKSAVNAASDSLIPATETGFGAARTRLQIAAVLLVALLTLLVVRRLRSGRSTG